MKKLIILLLVISPALFAQTSVNGRVQVGTNAVRLTQVPNPGDQWNTNDGHGAFICITAGTWSAIGGGGTNYQTIETASVAVVQEPILNFVNIPCVDNPGNTSTDCTASYQLILNNASALPQEPKWSAVPPLVATDNAANNRTDLSCPAAIGVGGSHSSGCVPDPGASGTTTDYLGRDMLYHTSGSASTVKPDPSTAIQYVAGVCNGGGACSDANDGLSWGTAKLTIFGALKALPNGTSTAAGSGTVYVGNGASANPTTTAGVWLMTSADPNFASPPAGWLTCSNCQVNLIGVPNSTHGANPHTGQVAVSVGSSNLNNDPAVWLSGNQQPIVIQNIYWQAPNAGLNYGRGFVIGECSNHDRTGTCAVSNSTFVNDSAVPRTGTSVGPCVDITGGTFWIWFRDFNCSGNAVSATGGRTANNAAAILIDGTSNLGNGFIYVQDTNLASGGIKFIPGSNSGGSLFVDHVTEEGDFTHDIPPVVWITGGQFVEGNMLGLQIADPGPTPTPAFQNDGQGTGISVLDAGGSSIAQGPATILNQGPNNFVNSTISPLFYSQTGFFNGYMIGETDTARRLAGLAPGRFTNNANNDNTTWVLSNAGGTTKTTGLADPYGGTTATKLAFNSGIVEGAQLGACVSYTPTVGDWIIGGIWVQGMSPTQNSFTLGCAGVNVPTFGTTYQNSGLQVGAATDWQFRWIAQKVSGANSATQMAVIAQYSNTLTPTLYGPVLFIIPSGTLSDNEVLAFAQTISSVDFSCAQGSVCNVKGHPVSVDTLNLRFNTFTGSLQAGTLTGNRTYTFPDASGTVPMFTGSITGGNNVCASGTAGLVTTVGCTGGGGSGTVSNALLNSFAIYTNPGTSNQIGGVAGPITPANVTQFLTYTPNGSVSGAPSVQLAGIPVRTNSTNNDTIVATDRNTLVAETFAGATTVNISHLLFNNGFAFKLMENSSNVNASIVLTPDTGTCNGASTCTLLAGQNATVTLDASGSNLLADIHEPGLVAGSGILFTRGQYSNTISAPGAVGTTGSPLASELTCFSAPTTITNCNLSGDATTSNTAAVTVVKVNGTTIPAGGALTTNTVPVVTGVSALTYEAVPNAALANSATTPNGQTCTLGSTCNVNVGAATHGIALNEGNGNAISGIAALTVNQIPVGVASADPVAGNLSELSATLYAADTGAVNVLTACSTPAAAALHTGQVIEVLPNHANTVGNPTLNWCSQGAKTITSFGSTLSNNDLVTTANAIVMYDGTNMELLNPQTNKVSTPPTWDAIGNAGNNKTFSNAGFTTTFNQTSNVAWTWGNTTTAASAAPQNSPTHVFSSQYWGTGPASLTDTWTLGPIIGTNAGINQPSTFTFTHSGTTGQAYVGMPLLTVTGNGAVSTAGVYITGNPYTAGNTTTNFPQLYLNAGTGPSTFSSGGTEFGINTPSGFTGNLIDGHVNGGSSVFSVDASGNVTANNVLTSTSNAASSKQLWISNGANKTATPITFPETRYAPAANCVNAVAGAGWSTGATPAALCRAGTNNKLGLLSPWGASDVGYIQFHIPADADLTTQLPSLMLEVTTTESSTHTIIMQEAISCAKEDGSTTDDVAFNAPRSFATVTETSRANQVFNTTITLNSPDLTGCTAPGIITVKISRTTDTATNVGVYGLSMTMYRLLTVQAN